MSRDAARTRRTKESEIFQELTALLPINETFRQQIDKAASLRLCLSHVTLRHLFGDESRAGTEDKVSQYCLRSLDGFVMLLKNDGQIIFVNESSLKELGLCQIDLIGQQVFEFIHPSDHDEINEVFKCLRIPIDNERKEFFIRFKCTLTTKGRSVNLKSAAHKVFRCIAQNLRVNSQHSQNVKFLTPYVLMYVEPIPHPSHVETPLDGQTFVTRHTMDMKFIEVDEKTADLLGYESDELIGKCLYEFHHGSDCAQLREHFKNLLNKGQMKTGLYRIIAKYGGFIWAHTQATLLYDKYDKPQYVLCVNFAVGSIEYPGIILSTEQSLKNETISLPDFTENDDLLDEYFGGDKKRETLLKPEDVELEQRAPFISMADVDDYTFDMVKPSSILDDSPELLGSTEMIFSSKHTDLEIGPESEKKSSMFVPRSKASDVICNIYASAEREQHPSKTKKSLRGGNPSDDYGGILQKLLVSGKDDENGYTLPSSQSNILELMNSMTPPTSPLESANLRANFVASSMLSSSDNGELFNEGLGDILN
ncbi:DgyrCDS9201 [Dimorphilus gyrociliatus]|uniref:DgyrCDS9201 n=1 Tax=Dimorphilus gyrociliatus TaxID=2664684 RepID=A0A7I8VWN3_9ANNE|nr:DgyrCDS9201 [Dimorphilus gyrociliatus]